MSLPTLAAAALAGLFGSAHCVGMCGGFVALLGLDGGRGVGRRQVAYFAGKTATYATFGALAGAAGTLLVDALGGLAGVVAVALGLAMVALGLGLCGVAWRRASTHRSGVAQHLAPAIGRLVASSSVPSLVGLGALNGLLPCGLVYGMLGVAAASGGAASGAATMTVFGLATLPALAATGWLGARLRPAGRRRMQRLAGMLVVAMGLLTAARGASALTPAPEPPVGDAVCHTPPSLD